MSKLPKKLTAQLKKLILQKLPKSYQTLTRIQLSKSGLVELLFQDGNVLVIVEPVVRAKNVLVHSSEMITHQRRRQLIIAAHQLQKFYNSKSVRIDIVTLDKVGDEVLVKLNKGVIYLSI